MTTPLDHPAGRYKDILGSNYGRKMNQHLPNRRSSHLMQVTSQSQQLAPIHTIETPIRDFWELGLTDVDILERIQRGNYYDRALFHLGLSAYRTIRRKCFGLEGTRQQHVTPEHLVDPMTAVRAMYPNAGTRECISVLFHEHGQMKASRSVMVEYFHRYEPELIRQRLRKSLVRRRFWAAGVNDLWTQDQHDKWKRFGLALHVCLEPFSGRLQWLKCWHNNNNPRIVLRYYLETVRSLGYIPLITQSDPGNENVLVARAQSMLRQWLDPSLNGTLQHRYMREKKNVMPEIAWSQFRRRKAPGIQNILEHGLNNDTYDPANLLDMYVFRWVFIPWVQLELDGYVLRINKTRKRHDKNKILPHGPPDDIYTNPARYRAQDFKVMVPPEAIDWVESELQDMDHPVLQLVPPDLEVAILLAYEGLGSPVLQRDNLWEIFIALRTSLESHNTLSIPEEEDLDDDNLMAENQVALQILHPLLDVNEEGEFPRYLGGVNNGRGFDAEQLAQMHAEDEEEFPAIGGIPSLDESEALREIAQEMNGRLEMDFSDDELYGGEAELPTRPDADAW